MVLPAAVLSAADLEFEDVHGLHLDNHLLRALRQEFMTDTAIPPPPRRMKIGKYGQPPGCKILIKGVRRLVIAQLPRDHYFRGTRRYVVTYEGRLSIPKEQAVLMCVAWCWRAAFSKRGRHAFLPARCFIQSGYPA